MDEPLTLGQISEYHADREGDIDFVFETAGEPVTIRMKASDLPALIANLFGAMEFFVENAGQPSFPRAMEPDGYAVGATPDGRLATIFFMLGKMRAPVSLPMSRALALGESLRKLPENLQRTAGERRGKAH